MFTSIHRSDVPTPALTRPKSVGAGWFRRVAVSLAALVAPVAVLAPAASQAEAFTWQGQTGSPGPAGLLVPVEGYSSGYAGDVVVPWMFAIESPAYKSSWQYVCATYRLWRQGPGLHQAGWNYQSSRASCSWIAPALDSAVIVGAHFAVTPYATYGVDIVVTWRLSPTGGVVGTGLVDLVHWNDFVCKSPAQRCAVGAGTLTLT